MTESTKNEQEKKELYNEIAGICESFYSIPYAQQKSLLAALTETWPKGVFPSDEKEIVGAIFMLASKNDDRTAQIKDDAIAMIWSRLEGYALTVVQKNYSTFLSNKDNMDDILSCCKIAVISKIGDYDPAAGVPITFFDRELHAAIREGIASTMPGMKVTSYHVEKQKQIRKALNQLESSGKLQTLSQEEIPAAICKLIPEMTRSSILAELQMMENSGSMVSLNAEDVPEVPAKLYNPEAECLQNENARLINQLLGNALTPLQMKICAHMDLMFDDSPEKAGKLAAACGLTLAEYRRERADMVRKLTVELQTGKYGEELARRFVRQTNELGSEKCVVFGHDHYDDAYTDMMDNAVDLDISDLSNNPEVLVLFAQGRAYEGRTEEMIEGSEKPERM